MDRNMPNTLISYKQTALVQQSHKETNKLAINPTKTLAVTYEA